jgi:membrane protein CcdC involved in cytochrome C biogenesis
MKDFKASFRQMPFLLKFLTILGCGGTLFIIVPFIPFANFEIEGKAVDINEFWNSGAAIGFILTGILLVIFTYKTILKNQLGRLFFIFAWCLACFNPYAFRMGYILDWGYMMNSLIPLGFWSWYLYLKKSVQVYYGTE